MKQLTDQGFRISHPSKAALETYVGYCSGKLMKIAKAEGDHSQINSELLSAYVQMQKPLTNRRLQMPSTLEEFRSQDFRRRLKETKKLAKEAADSLSNAFQIANNCAANIAIARSRAQAEGKIAEIWQDGKARIEELYKQRTL